MRNGISETDDHKRIVIVIPAFPNPWIENYEFLIFCLKLLDENDIHVLAAAVKVDAHSMVTSKRKHFSIEYISWIGLSVVNTDDFFGQYHRSQP